VRGKPNKPGEGWLPVFVPDHGRVPDHFHPVLDQYLDLPAREAALHIKPGMPILVSPDYEVDPLLVAYFYSEAFDGLTPKTQENEARDIKAWLNYLDNLSVHWCDARPSHFKAFRALRTDRDLVRRLVAAGQMEPAQGTKEVVTHGTFATAHFALARLYKWAVAQRHARQSPIPKHVQGASRTAKSAGSQQPKWFMPTTFQLWRNVGLLGHAVVVNDAGRPAWGDFDRSWKGGVTASRNAAYVDLSVTTGLRRREMTLLVDEVQGSESLLATVVTKSQRARVFDVSQGIVDEIDSYVRYSRRAAVRRARREHRYDRWAAEEPLLVLDHWDWDSRGQRVFVAEDGTETVLDRAKVAERLRMARRTEDGIEPMLLWLGHHGMPLAPEAWNTVLTDANKRVAACMAVAGFNSAPPSATIHSLRFTFALFKLAALSRVIAERESLSLLNYNVRDYGAAFDIVKDDLGHRSRQTTIDIYLEPVKGLLQHAYFDNTVGMALEDVIGLLVGDSPLVHRQGLDNGEGAR
jgi:hypothetical protein